MSFLRSAARDGAGRPSWAALAALVALSCSAREQPQRSAILITLDTTRADALGCYGGPPENSPHLDLLAAEGVLFERAYTVAPLTLPAHSSMLTGLYPPRHGVRNNGPEALPPGAATLAEAAQEAGFQTAAFLSAAVLHRRFGLFQGFAVYDAPEDSDRSLKTHYPSRLAHDTAAKAISWLRDRDRDRPFFLWLHLWDPHAPYQAPERFQRQNPYWSEVACTDDAIGELIAALKIEGLWAETPLLVVADHGEAFGEHGEWTHGVLCYETTLRVPLILRDPANRDNGRRSTRLASVIDVFPTLAVAMGLPAAGGLDGRNLYQEEEPRRGLYFESYYGHYAYGWSPLCGWLDEGGKYLHGERPRFFHPATDPAEEHDLAAERSTALPVYRAAISAVAALPRVAIAAAAEPLDEELRASLEELGYATAVEGAAETPEPLDGGGRPNPMDQQEALAAIERAAALLNGGKYAEAERLYAQIVAADPDNLWCQELLGTSRMLLNRHRDALAPLRLVVQGGRASAVTYGNLGVCLRATGRDDLALPYFLRALELHPTRKGALQHVVEILRSQGREAEAAPYAERLKALGGAPEQRRDSLQSQEEG